MWQPGRPWNELPDLPPAAELETRAVLKTCISARAALAELKQAAELIPNQAILVGTLPMLEARASSEIENIVTTNDRLFQFQHAEEHADAATKEALRYRHALLEGYGALSTRPICTHTAEVICSTIKAREMTIRRVPGTTLKNSRDEVIYTPPVGEDRLRTLLRNWEQFMHQRDFDVDPIVRMAVGHYQFEAIHPFTDGNGRTGRILNSLFLIQYDLLSMPILYLSRYIIERKAEYYRLLLKVTTDGAWEEWLLYMIEGVESTAQWTTHRIRAMRDLFAHTSEHVRSRLPKIYSHELITVIFEQPYCRIQNIVDAGIVERQAASRYLNALADIDVLQPIKFGREKLFLHPKLLKLLTRETNEWESH